MQVKLTDKEDEQRNIIPRSDIEAQIFCKPGNIRC